MENFAIIGFAVAFCTTISFLPQAIKTIKTRLTRDLSFIMYTVLVIATALWTVTAS